ARAAGAGIVTADLWALAHDGLGNDFAVGEKPGTVTPYEACLLVVLLSQAALDICRLELDHAFILRWAAVLGLQDLEAEPRGSFAPVPGSFYVDPVIVVAEAGC